MADSKLLYDLLEELEIDCDPVLIGTSSNFVSDGLLDSLDTFVLLSALQDKYCIEFPKCEESGEYVFSMERILNFIDSAQT